MKKLDLKNEVGSTLLIIKKNHISFYYNLILKYCFSILTIFLIIETVVKDFAWEGICWVAFSVALLVYCSNSYEKAKEKYLIISKDTSILDTFILRSSTSKKVEEINFCVYGLKSVSIKNNGEVILLSEEEFPWGNRKVILSDEYMERKSDVSKLLNSYV